MTMGRAFGYLPMLGIAMAVVLVALAGELRKEAAKPLSSPE